MFKNVSHIFKGKCPNCNTGAIFKSKQNFWNLPEMNPTCPSCSNKFEKEPGFFFGAMYVSYALGVVEAILTYVLVIPFLTDAFDLRVVPFIATVLVLLTYFNVKLSRTLWIYIFKSK